MTGERQRAADRHVLVSAIWFALAFVAATLFATGFAGGGSGYILAGFGALLAAFAAHVVVNAATRTRFTTGELALGLVAYAVALVAVALATLAAPQFRDEAFLAVFAGLGAILVAALFYLVTAYGLRRTFDAFDAIRSFRP